MTQEQKIKKFRKLKYAIAQIELNYGYLLIQAAKKGIDEHVNQRLRMRKAINKIFDKMENLI